MIYFFAADLDLNDLMPRQLYLYILGFRYLVDGVSVQGSEGLGSERVNERRTRGLPCAYKLYKCTRRPLYS